jgi:hypothetical protein
MGTKAEMLEAHESQKEVLMATQGVQSLQGMRHSAFEMGEASGRFTCAEGWRRHLHTGLSAVEIDPLSEVLGPLCWTDPDYEADLG